MIRTVLGKARPGSIIIFHINGRGWKTARGAAGDRARAARARVSLRAAVGADGVGRRADPRADSARVDAAARCPAPHGRPVRSAVPSRSVPLPLPPRSDAAAPSGRSAGGAGPSSSARRRRSRASRRSGSSASSRGTGSAIARSRSAATWPGRARGRRLDRARRRRARRPAIVVATDGFLLGGFIALLAVRPEASGQGLGHARWSRTSRPASSRRRRWLFVSCDAGNRAALRFYRRQGFARVGRLPDLVRAGRIELLLRKARS